MKKTYLSPETLLVLVATQKMIAASVDGFNSTLDNSDDNAIGTKDMLSRRKHNDVWEDEEEEEEY